MNGFCKKSWYPITFLAYVCLLPSPYLANLWPEEMLEACNLLAGGAQAGGLGLWAGRVKAADR